MRFAAHQRVIRKKINPFFSEAKKVGSEKKDLVIILELGANVLLLLFLSNKLIWCIATFAHYFLIDFRNVFFMVSHCLYSDRYFLLFTVLYFFNDIWRLVLVSGDSQIWKFFSYFYLYIVPMLVCELYYCEICKFLEKKDRVYCLICHT